MEGKTTVKYLQHYIRARDHKPDIRNVYFMKLAEEVGELSRAMLDGRKAESPEKIRGTIDEELWDVMYYALALANLYNIDMEEVIKVKSAINEMRYPGGFDFEEGH